MPNCFSLTRKSEPEKGPVGLNTIDAEMCQHFGVPCDPKQYYGYWYQSIGLGLACGGTFETMRKEIVGLLDHQPQDEFYNPKLTVTQLAIIDWLDEHFTADAWYQAH